MKGVTEKLKSTFGQGELGGPCRLTWAKEGSESQGQEEGSTSEPCRLSRFPSAPPLKSEGLDQCDPEVVAIDAVITK